MQGWGRKRCSRRLCPPRICVQMPRPCLDSLQIPALRPCVLHGTPRREFPPCIQPSCGVKHPICHCVDNNYCTSETCKNCTSCMKSHNVFCPYGIKGDKDEDSVCPKPCRKKEAGEKNHIEDYEKIEPSCNEATCEEKKNCGVGASSTSDEELNHPVSYIPSVTNQNELNGSPSTVSSRQVSSNNDSSQGTNHINDPSQSIVDFNGKLKAPNSNNSSEEKRFSSVNKSIQVNIQNETVSKRSRDAESTVAPKKSCSGNEVPNLLSLTGLSQCNSSNVNKILPERYDTTAQSYNQPSKTSESHLNAHVSNLENKGGKSRDNGILLSDQNNSKNSYNLSASFEPKSQEQLNNSENRKLGDNLKKNKELSQQNVKLSSEHENLAERNPINETPMQSAPQKFPIINADRQHIRDTSQDNLPQENFQSKKPVVNESTTNELANTSLLGNNSTNQKKNLNENQNQLVSIKPNDCCKSGVTHGHLNSFESTSQKLPHVISPSFANTEPTRSGSQPPQINDTSKQFRGSPLNQGIFQDNNHINSATYSSPIKNQNLRNNAHPQSSKMEGNNKSFKEMNVKKQPTNSDFDQKYGSICEDCKQGCCSYGSSERLIKNRLPLSNLVSDLECVCFGDKHKQNRSLLNLKDIRCEKKPACIIEDGTTSCVSTTCITNSGCRCRYPPAYKQFICSGNISGICNCNDK